jgi:hypothetical protein
MYKASKFCPQCKRRFTLSESRCTTCRSARGIYGGVLATELWTVVILPGGRGWQHYPPQALNDAALKRLAGSNKEEAPDGPDAA